MLPQLIHRVLNLLPETFVLFLQTKLNPNYPPINFHNLYKVEVKPDELATTAIGREFLKHSGYETVKWGQYMAGYDRFLSRFRSGILDSSGSKRKVKLLEIGVRAGGSLQVFQNYFGDCAEIVGIDIDDRCSNLRVSPARIRIGDQADTAFLKSVVAELGGIDIVIDDGSHLPEHQVASLNCLWPLLDNNGVYIIEDTHTSYWRTFGGGYRNSAGFIEFVKDAIDGMHGWYSRHHMTQRGKFAMTQVSSITVYDSMVVFEKCQERRPTNLRFGQERTFK